MKKPAKSTIQLLLLELIFFAEYTIRKKSVAAVFGETHRWLFAYLVFIACIYAALSIKEPKKFFTVFGICTVIQFILVKKTLILSAPITLIVWVFLNVIEKKNSEDLSDKKQRGKLFAVNMVFPVVCVALFFATFPLNTIQGTNAYTANTRDYQVPIVAFLLYFAYSLFFKSNFPHIVKARTALISRYKKFKQYN